VAGSHLPHRGGVACLRQRVGFRQVEPYGGTARDSPGDRHLLARRIAIPRAQEGQPEPQACRGPLLLQLPGRRGERQEGAVRLDRPLCVSALVARSGQQVQPHAVLVGIERVHPVEQAVHRLPRPPPCLGAGGKEPVVGGHAAAALQVVAHHPRGSPRAVGGQEGLGLRRHLRHVHPGERVVHVALHPLPDLPLVPGAREEHQRDGQEDGDNGRKADQGAA
jgi:hypothetical protein